MLLMLHGKLYMQARGYNSNTTLVLLLQLGAPPPSCLPSIQDKKNSSAHSPVSVLLLNPKSSPSSKSANWFCWLARKSAAGSSSPSKAGGVS